VTDGCPSSIRSGTKFEGAIGDLNFDF